MRIRRQLGNIVSAAAVLLVGTAAHAGARPFMPLGETIAAPPGYTDLCERGEVTCEALETASAAPGQAAPAALTTFSIGNGSAPRFEAQAPVAGETSILQFVVLRTYRPTIDSQFAVAGARMRAAIESDVQTVAAPVATSAASTEPALVRAAQMRLVNTINRQVNKDVLKATDFDLYGLLEYWSLPRVKDGKMYGDCEDYALEKRRRLIAAGVPESALSMAVAVTARGETHAVLVVSFESGDWVLDNLTPWATPWEDLNYRWVQRQVAGSSTWTTIG